MDAAAKADLLRRMTAGARPCGDWIASVVEDLEPHAAPIQTLGFERLPAYFPDPLLAETRSVTVPRIPIPPFTSFGIPEFAAVEQMAAAGITFGTLCVVHADQATESVHFHELVHAVQWKTLGEMAYMLTYGVGLIEHGYAQSPLETAAFDMQSQFDRERPIAHLVETVSARAREAHGAAVALLREHGVEPAR